MHDITYMGLYHWSQCMFQKLGWMLLSHHENDKEQVRSYVTSIKNLLSHIDLKLSYLRSLNKGKQMSLMIHTHIHDMDILKKDVTILYNYAVHLLVTTKNGVKRKLFRSNASIISAVIPANVSITKSKNTKVKKMRGGGALSMRYKSDKSIDEFIEELKVKINEAQTQNLQPSCIIYCENIIGEMKKKTWKEYDVIGIYDTIDDKLNDFATMNHEDLKKYLFQISTTNA